MSLFWIKKSKSVASESNSRKCSACRLRGAEQARVAWWTYHSKSWSDSSVPSLCSESTFNAPNVEGWNDWRRDSQGSVTWHGYAVIATACCCTEAGDPERLSWRKCFANLLSWNSDNVLLWRSLLHCSTVFPKVVLELGKKAQALARLPRTCTLWTWLSCWWCSVSWSLLFVPRFLHASQRVTLHWLRLSTSANCGSIEAGSAAGPSIINDGFLRACCAE